MAFDVKTTPDFERSVKKIVKKYKSFPKDILSLIDELETNPMLGTDLGNNLFKIRLGVTGMNKGKSGGARVITYVKILQSTVLLAEVYLKSEFDTVDEAVIISRLTQQGFI